MFRGGSRKTPRGGSRIEVVPLPIPKIKNSSDFGHLILVVPYFHFFHFWSVSRPVVPLAGLWCPRAPRGDHDPYDPPPLDPPLPMFPFASQALQLPKTPASQSKTWVKPLTAHRGIRKTDRICPNSQPRHGYLKLTRKSIGSQQKQDQQRRGEPRAGHHGGFSAPSVSLGYRRFCPRGFRRPNAEPSTGSRQNCSEVTAPTVPTTWRTDGGGGAQSYVSTFY